MGWVGLQKTRTLVKSFCPGCPEPECAYFPHCPLPFQQPLCLARRRILDGASWTWAFYPFPPPSLARLHPGSCLLASVCLSGCLCVCLIFSAFLILVLCLSHPYICLCVFLGLSFGLPVPAYT